MRMSGAMLVDIMRRGVRMHCARLWADYSARRAAGMDAHKALHLTYMPWKSPREFTEFAEDWNKTFLGKAGS